MRPHIGVFYLHIIFKGLDYHNLLFHFFSNVIEFKLFIIQAGKAMTLVFTCAKLVTTRVARKTRSLADT